MGRAVQAGGSFLTSSDVSAFETAWHDPRFLDSRWDAGYSYRRDGLERSHAGNLSHPFYSETVRWSADFGVDAARGRVRIFQDGRTVERIGVDQTVTEGLVALHGPHRRLSRLALFGARRHLRGADTPASDIAAVGVSWGLLRREYRRTEDLDYFGVGEDVAAGWTFQLGGGADLHALGGDRDRALWRADAAWARFLGPGALVGATLRQHAFVHRGRLENARLAAETYGYWQRVGTHTLAWRAGYAALVDEPRFLRFTLGGDELLRGYPARSVSGTRAAWLNVEERLFTGWHVLFLRLGAAAFVDVAQAWDSDPGPALRRTRLGGGVGLRVGNNKAGSGLTSLDLGFGTRSVQVSLSTGSFFRVARDVTFLSPRLFR